MEMEHETFINDKKENKNCDGTINLKDESECDGKLNGQIIHHNKTILVNNRYLHT
jgi:hypothetical protein